MKLREMLESLDEGQVSPRQVAEREAGAIGVIGNALKLEIRRAPDFVRGSDKQRMERHLDEIDMAVRTIRAELKKWKG